MQLNKDPAMEVLGVVLSLSTITVIVTHRTNQCQVQLTVMPQRGPPLEPTMATSRIYCDVLLLSA